MMTPEQRDKRLTELKLRLDAVHEIVIHALKAQDDTAIDRVFEQQRQIVEEYNALLKQQPRETTNR